MPGGGCRGGIPGLGPCMTPVPGMVITGATGDPSGSVPASEGVPMSPLGSLVDSSFTFPAAKEDKIKVLLIHSGKLNIVAAQKNRPESKSLKK